MQNSSKTFFFLLLPSFKNNIYDLSKISHLSSSSISGCKCKYMPLYLENVDMFFRCCDSYFYKCFNGTVAFKIPTKAMDWNSETCLFLHGKNHRLGVRRICGVKVCFQGIKKIAWLSKTTSKINQSKNPMKSKTNQKITPRKTWCLLWSGFPLFLEQWIVKVSCLIVTLEQLFLALFKLLRS